jgi:hypothetical protein
LSEFRFGDFDGDGITDVLASDRGRWAISSGARTPWQRLNPFLNDDLALLSHKGGESVWIFIADLNNNNKDDVVRLRQRLTYPQWTDPMGGPRSGHYRETWEVSWDGATRWQALASREQVLPYNQAIVSPYAYVGRFGFGAQGAHVMAIDPAIRHGRFWGKLSGKFQAWWSAHPY